MKNAWRARRDAIPPVVWHHGRIARIRDQTAADALEELDLGATVVLVRMLHDGQTDDAVQRVLGIPPAATQAFHLQLNLQRARGNGTLPRHSGAHPSAMARRLFHGTTRVLRDPTRRVQTTTTQAMAEIYGFQAPSTGFSMAGARAITQLVAMARAGATQIRITPLPPDDEPAGTRYRIQWAPTRDGTVMDQHWIDVLVLAVVRARAVYALRRSATARAR